MTKIYTIVHWTGTSRDNTSFKAILADHMKRYGRLYYNDYIEPNSFFPVHNTLNYRGPGIFSRDIVLTGKPGEEQTAYQIQQLDRLIKKYGYPVLGHSEAPSEGLVATKSACPGIYLLNHLKTLKNEPMASKLKIRIIGKVPHEINLSEVAILFEDKIDFLQESVAPFHMRLTFQPTYKKTDMRTGGVDTPTLYEKDKIWDAFIYTSDVVNPSSTYEELIEDEILHILFFKDGLGEIHPKYSKTSNWDVYGIWKELGVPIDNNIELHLDKNNMKLVQDSKGRVWAIQNGKRLWVLDPNTRDSLIKLTGNVILKEADGEYVGGVGVFQTDDPSS